MKKLKWIVCVALAVALLWPNTTMVKAADHVQGCTCMYSTKFCGSFVSSATVAPHTVNIGGGDTVTCNRTEWLYFHSILCSNSSCRAVYEENVVEACRRTHGYSGCATDTGLCK